jgi:putative 4-mercaptohistidine N1-methyltranferase
MGPRDALEFPARCVRDCLLTDRLPEQATALDVGCAVGRSTFELARHCHTVRGVDYSARFITIARELQHRGTLGFPMVIEGDRIRTATASVPEGVDVARITFDVCDALTIDPADGSFDVVFAANLLDRVPRPRRLLEILGGLVKPGGQLILTSPYTWLEEYTPPAEWLCREGRSSTEVLEENLPDFERVRRLDLPFLIREHSRKYQWSVAEATVWVRSGTRPRSD